MRERLSRLSLRNRIAAAAGLAVAIAVIGGAVAIYVAVRSELRGEVDTALRERAQPIAMLTGGAGGTPGSFGNRRPPAAIAPPAAADAYGTGGPPAYSDPDDANGAPFDPGRDARRYGGAAGFIQFVSPSGAVHRPGGGSSSTLKLPVDGAAKSIAKAGTGQRFTDLHREGLHLRVLTVGVGRLGAVQVARPLDEADYVLHRVLLIEIIIVVAGIALAAGLGTAVARSALAPIGRFTRRTEAIAGNPDMSERIDVVGHDELSRLAASFNRTLDSLEQSVEAQRHLVADASHELRTPIASLRANVQVLEESDRLPPEELAALRADIISELDELTDIVAGVVELARGRAQDSEALDDVRLDMIVEALAERAGRRGADKVSFELELEPTVVRGEPERINRAVSNVIDNARKWSSDGGRVEVSLNAGALAVRDHGPGFAETDLPHVFERFYRSEQARAMPGSGLGLAIVRQAAEETGGTATVANAPGGGALVTLRFGGARPVAADAGEAPAPATPA